MTDIQVRQATLDDTAAISALFRAAITVWQRLDAQGRVQTVPYEGLTIYERWLHGGPWMSIETAAIQLNQLLGGAGIALVAETGEQPVGFVEAYHSVEPAPFGDHLHVAQLAVVPEFEGRGIEAALLTGLLERAKKLKVKTLALTRTGNLVNIPLPPDATLQPLARLLRVSMSARTGQIFYRATDHPNPAAAQIHGWHMAVGRQTNARQEWETLWPPTWDGIKEIRELRTHRLHFAAAGQEAYVAFRRQMYDPRSADIFCWSPKPLTPQLVAAIRDHAHREGYRTLSLLVTEDTAKTLGADAEPDGYTLDTCAIKLGEG